MRRCAEKARIGCGGLLTYTIYEFTPPFSYYESMPELRRTFRLKGKGLPSKDGHGDLFATVRIVLPYEKDVELEALMRKWREEKPYDPRKDFE